MGKAGVLFHLLLIGLIGAATVTMFGMASMSLLYKERPIVALRRPSTIAPDIEATAVAISADTSSPTLDSPKGVPVSPPQNLSTGETSEITRGNPSFEQPSDNLSASARISEPPDGLPLRDPPINTTSSTEIFELEAQVREPLPAAEMSVTIDDVRSLPTVSAERRDHMASEALNRQIETAPQHPPDGAVQDNRILDGRPSVQKVQRKDAARGPMKPNSALQRRIQRECGPITFPALRRHCIASFSIR
jgi:hypothetical protein